MCSVGRNFSSYSSVTILAVVLLCSSDITDALSSKSTPPTKPNKASQQRRVIIAAAFGLFSSAGLGSTGSINTANAFPNHVADYAKYAEKAKRRGTPPKDLGVQKRTTEGDNEEIIELGLRSCDGNPNCFSTTGDYFLEDRQQYGVDYLIAPWQPPKGEDPKQSFQNLVNVVKAYEPGQGGIDGGGFGVVQETEVYLYCQFESLKKGFIDDVEFALGNNKILVRSASRLGFTDFGVNAVRLNYIAAKLRAKGWEISEITSKSHPDYWNSAGDAKEATFDPDRRQIKEA